MSVPSIGRGMCLVVGALGVAAAWPGAVDAAAGGGGGAPWGERGRGDGGAPIATDRRAGAGSVAGHVESLPLPFIEDDYARAIAEARRTRRPLLVDAWAPWCHTCLSLRAFVFTAPALRPLRERYVWAAIDTENPVNARFVDTHPIDAWPTLFVVDADTGATRRLYRGALRPSELVAWLLDAAGPERAAEERVSALRRAHDNVRCVAEAEASLHALAPGTAYLNVAAEGLTCAGALPGDAGARASRVSFFSSALEKAVDDAAFPVLADDRSSGFEALVAAAQSSGDGALAQSRARRWWAVIEKAAALAPSPVGRAVFDAHKTEAALALQQPALAIPALQESARDFPRDYNPPARLARLYLAAGRVADARVEIDRGLRLVYGPRRKRLEALEAQIATAERSNPR